ncbi:proton-coupled amino acid transporter-like protein acs [Arctopsyche grandis]|uniref:proton-coupled amino acid transporter-like protein acs n=1 Tax=Arctopsyche grandis TaxID=121162 RepID=UPI00406D6FFB
MTKSPKNSIGLDNFNSTANLADNGVFQSTISISPGEEVNEKEYDPYDHRQVEHPNSDFGSLVHLLKSSLGSGILAMPNAIKNSGIVFGAVGTFIIGVVCTHCVHILVKISHELCKESKVPSMTFAETCGAAFKYGPKRLRCASNGFRLFVDWALVATYIGAACVYVMLIAESFHDVIGYHYPETNWDKRLYCAIIMIPLILLGQIRNLKYLVPFSALANVLLLITLAIIMSYIFADIPPTDDKEIYFTSAAKLPLFISTVIFAMEGIGVVMPVENDMKNPRRFLGCPGVLNISMSVVVTLYAIIGIFGYLKYGNLVNGNITSILEEGDIQAQVAKICIGLAILFTYGLQFYVPSDIIFKKIESVQNPKYHNITHIVLRTVLVAFTVAIAVVVPQLDLLISFVGAVFFSTLGLLIPAIVEIVHCWDGNLGFFYWRLIKDVLIGLFSIVALVSGAYQSLNEMINGAPIEEPGI